MHTESSQIEELWRSDRIYFFVVNNHHGKDSRTSWPTNKQYNSTQHSQQISNQTVQKTVRNACTTTRNQSQTSFPFSYFLSSILLSLRPVPLSVKIFFRHFSSSKHKSLLFIFDRRITTYSRKPTPGHFCPKPSPVLCYQFSYYIFWYKKTITKKIFTTVSIWRDDSFEFMIFILMIVLSSCFWKYTPNYV